MKKLFTITLAFSLFSCGSEKNQDEFDATIRIQVEERKFDYSLPEPELPINYQHFED